MILQESKQPIFNYFPVSTDGCMDVTNSSNSLRVKKYKRNEMGITSSYQKNVKNTLKKNNSAPAVLVQNSRDEQKKESDFVSVLASNNASHRKGVNGSIMHMVVKDQSESKSTSKFSSKSSMHQPKIDDAICQSERKSGSNSEEIEQNRYEELSRNAKNKRNTMYQFGFARVDGDPFEQHKWKNKMTRKKLHFIKEGSILGRSIMQQGGDIPQNRRNANRKKVDLGIPFSANGISRKHIIVSQIRSNAVSIEIPRGVINATTCILYSKAEEDNKLDHYELRAGDKLDLCHGDVVVFDSYEPNPQQVFRLIHVLDIDSDDQSMCMKRRKRTDVVDLIGNNLSKREVIDITFDNDNNISQQTQNECSFHERRKQTIKHGNIDTCSISETFSNSNAKDVNKSASKTQLETVEQHPSAKNHAGRSILWENAQIDPLLSEGTFKNNASTRPVGMETGKKQNQARALTRASIYTSITSDRELNANMKETSNISKTEMKQRNNLCFLKIKSPSREDCKCTPNGKKRKAKVAIDDDVNMSLSESITQGNDKYETLLQGCATGKMLKLEQKRDADLISSQHSLSFDDTRRVEKEYSYKTEKRYLEPPKNIADNNMIMNKLEKKNKKTDLLHVVGDVADLSYIHTTCESISTDGLNSDFEKISDLQSDDMKNTCRNRGSRSIQITKEANYCHTNKRDLNFQKTIENEHHEGDVFSPKSQLSPLDKPKEKKQDVDKSGVNLHNGKYNEIKGIEKDRFNNKKSNNFRLRVVSNDEVLCSIDTSNIASSQPNKLGSFRCDNEADLNEEKSQELCLLSSSENLFVSPIDSSSDNYKLLLSPLLFPKNEEKQDVLICEKRQLYLPSSQCFSLWRVLTSSEPQHGLSLLTQFMSVYNETPNQYLLQNIHQAILEGLKCDEGSKLLDPNKVEIISRIAMKTLAYKSVLMKSNDSILSSIEKRLLNLYLLMPTFPRRLKTALLHEASTAIGYGERIIKASMVENFEENHGVSIPGKKVSQSGFGNDRNVLNLLKLVVRISASGWMCCVMNEDHFATTQDSKMQFLYECGQFDERIVHLCTCAAGRLVSLLVELYCCYGESNGRKIENSIIECAFTIRDEFLEQIESVKRSDIPAFHRERKRNVRNLASIKRQQQQQYVRAIKNTKISFIIGLDRKTTNSALGKYDDEKLILSLAKILDVENEINIVLGL